MGSVVKSVGSALGFGGGGGPGPKLDMSKFDFRKDVEKRVEPGRAASTALLTDLQKQARGEGPSLAEAQMKSASNRSLAQTLAAASAQRGGSTAGTQRQLLNLRGDQARQLAQESAIARMQEQQAAQQLLANQSIAQQGQDLAQVIQPGQILSSGEQKRFEGDVARRNAVQQQQSSILGSTLGAGGAILGGMAQGGTGLFSDKTAKKNIKPAKKEVSKFLDALSAREYEYKDASLPGAAEGKRVGVMAQDVEKSTLGQTLVKNTPNGKAIDTVQGFGAVLAAQAELNKRLKKLEKKG